MSANLGNKGHKGDVKNIRHQKQGGEVVKIEDKMVEGQNKLSAKSAQSLSCHLRSPEGRVLAETIESIS